MEANHFAKLRLTYTTDCHKNYVTHASKRFFPNEGVQLE